MNKKRILCLLLCVVLAVCLAAGAFAEGISPRWTYISQMSAGIDKNLVSYNVAASATLYNSSYTVKVTTTLQQWSSGWGDTSHSWTSKETGRTEAAGNVYLGSGVYRVKATATVYNTSGTQVETTTIYSDSYTID